MKNFKIFDLSISIILILFFTPAFLFWRESIFLSGYFVVGGWQVISMLIHFSNRWFTAKGSSRDTYQMAVLSIFLITLLGLLFTPVLFMLLYFLLVVAPLMAILYSIICFNEIRSLSIRPLSLLK